MEKNELLKKFKNLGFKEKTLQAFASIQRENFVPKELKHRAYEDTPLPIGHGQTISQPHTIAIMLEELDPQEGQKVLEVGSGCGYVLALLSTIVGKKGQVIGLELSPELANISIQNVEKYENIKVYEKDGIKGFFKEVFFDRILISAASLKIPPKLTEQLKNDGVLVAPVGPSFQQSIVTIQKKKDKPIIKNRIPGFIFVPLVEKTS